VLTLTPAARQKFLEAAKAEGREGDGLRVIVNGGGSAQPQFALNFVAADEISESDTVLDSGELKVYVDADSVRWLKDASIDFVDGLEESGFKVDAPNAGIPRPSGPLAEAVLKVLDEKINPGVASHGGVVSLVAVENETAYLRFGGGCQGCGMSSYTLKQGIEKTLFEEVPEIKKVVDVTDHAAGTNPYYESNAG
jgi:Fe/S biogenesis protein NfuA